MSRDPKAGEQVRTAVCPYMRVSVHVCPRLRVSVHVCVHTCVCPRADTCSETCMGLATSTCWN